MNKPMVVVLAGGVGVHFEPISIDKTLMPFLGKPYIVHILDILAEIGFEEALISTNKRNHDFISGLSYPSLSLYTKLQANPLGMGNALINLKDEIANRSIIVINAVDLLNKSLFEAVLDKAKLSYGVIPGIKVDSYFPGGYLKVVRDKVVDIIEKPPPGSQPSDLINLVCHYFQKPQDLFLELEKTTHEKDDHYEKSLSRLMQKHPFDFVSYESYWSKLKYSDLVLDVTDIFLRYRLQKHISPTAQLEKGVHLEGKVYVDEGAKIMSGAVIKGPCYIGKDAVIGNQTLIRSSVIERKAVIGFGSEVVRSYIGPECELHHNFIGDSVLEAKINPSYGTCTANLRLDKSNARLKLLKEVRETGKKKLGAIIAEGVFLGVGSIILPGVTIGRYAKIYPGTIVHKAVPPYSIIKTYNKQEIITNPENLS